MNCHVAWMERIVAFGDFLCEALVGSVRGQRRQRVLETPNRLTSILKESLADPWCDRLRTHKCPVSPESRSRDGCCSIVVLEVQNVGKDDSEGGEKVNKKVRHMDIRSKCRTVRSGMPRSVSHATKVLREGRKELRLQRKLNDTSQTAGHSKDGLVICASNVTVHRTISTVDVPKKMVDTVDNRAIGQPILHLKARHETKYLQITDDLGHTGLSECPLEIVRSNGGTQHPRPIMGNGHEWRQTKTAQKIGRNSGVGRIAKSFVVPELALKFSSAETLPHVVRLNSLLRVTHDVNVITVRQNQQVWEGDG